MADQINCQIQAIKKEVATGIYTMFYQVAIEVSQNEPLTPAKEILAQNFLTRQFGPMTSELQDFIVFTENLQCPDSYEL